MHKSQILFLLAVFASPIAMADSFQNMSDATLDSADASARLAASGTQVALGAVAVPLAGLGALAEAGGETATEISADLWDVANTPLKVDDAVVIAQPLPDMAQSSPANPIHKADPK